MEYCFHRTRIFRILLSTMFFSVIFLMMFASQSSLKQQGHFVVSSPALVSSYNNHCDCNTYCAQVLNESTSSDKRHSNRSIVVRTNSGSEGFLSSTNSGIELQKNKKSIKSSNKISQLTVRKAISEVQELAKKNQVEKLAPSGKATKYVFIVTTWRSGSSFFGEALSSHPAIFYHFEPLMYLYMKEVNGDGKDFENEFKTLEYLSKCEYSKATRYVYNLEHTWNVLTRNLKIQAQCMKLKENCFDFDFLKTSCMAFPVQLFKLTRIRGKAAEELLKRFGSSKIIYLVRDPRATYSSRMQVGWCPAPTWCGNITVFCNDLEEDLAEIRTLQARHRESVLVVKYEHVVTNAVENFKRIYNFLGIDWHDNVQNYLSEHTHKNTADPMSTVKDSIKHIDKWKYSLANETIQKVQRECGDFMKNLQYNFI